MPPLRNKVHVEIAKQQLIRHSLLARGAVGPHACYAAEASWLVTAPARASLRLCRARTPPTEQRTRANSGLLYIGGLGQEDHRIDPSNCMGIDGCGQSNGQIGRAHV